MLINGDRLWRSIEEMGQVGAGTGGGSCRVALTDADKEGRDLFVGWCTEAGCRVQIDVFGNIFAHRYGSDPTAPAVLFGSHLDTQPTGGRFDGVYGVLAGLEIMRTLNDADIRTRRPLAVVNWTNEEGVRFNPGLTGSEGFAGVRAIDEILSSTAIDGPAFGAELERIGYAGARDAPPLSVAAYLELHIEQGPVLESAGREVGVVTGVQGVRWFNINIAGSSRHAGTTPMDARQDAFMAAARAALFLRQECGRLSKDLRVTVGRMSLAPGSINTSPGEAQFTLDLRHPDTSILDRVEKEVFDRMRQEAARESCTMTIERMFCLPPTMFPPELVKTLEVAASAGGHDWQHIVSGAMHDACALARIVPTAMIFTSCKDGISHNEAEFASPSAVAAGCDVLYRAVLAVGDDPHQAIRSAALSNRLSPVS